MSATTPTPSLCALILTVLGPWTHLENVVFLAPTAPWPRDPQSEAGNALESGQPQKLRRAQRLLAVESIKGHTGISCTHPNVRTWRGPVRARKRGNGSRGWSTGPTCKRSGFSPWHLGAVGSAPPSRVRRNPELLPASETPKHNKESCHRGQIDSPWKQDPGATWGRSGERRKGGPGPIHLNVNTWHLPGAPPAARRGEVPAGKTLSPADRQGWREASCPSGQKIPHGQGMLRGPQTLKFREGWKHPGLSQLVSGGAGKWPAAPCWGPRGRGLRPP